MASSAPENGAGNKGKDKPKLSGHVSFAPHPVPEDRRPLLQDDDIERGNEQETDDEDAGGSVSRLYRKSKLGLLLGSGKKRASRGDDEDSIWKSKWVYAGGWLLLVLVVVGVIVAAVLLDNGDHPTGPSPGPPRPPHDDYSAVPTSTRPDGGITIPAPPFPTGMPRNPAYLIKAANGAVAAENELCSNIGVDLLKAGGSAVDAAIGSALCVGTVNMFASGIGGGGFMTIRPPEGGSAICIDFRETAPQASNRTMFGKSPLTSLFGGLAVGVPGELRGLEIAHKMYGRLPWKTVLQPVVELAKGWKIQPELDRRMKWLGGFMLDSPEWRAVFAPHGKLLTEGEWIHRTNYSRTLQRIADEGPDAFYHGEIAESIVQKIRSDGGIMTVEDFAGYKANVYDAITGSYRGNKIYTTGAPTSGPVLLHILSMLERFDFPHEGMTGLNLHRIVEALKFGFAARTEISDLAFSNNSARVEEISTKEFSREMSEKIDDERTHTADYYGPVYDIPADHGTMHLSVVDSDGMAVALTSTVNLIFGSRVMDPITGVILNDELDDFARPDQANYFGLWPSPYNYPEAGKRPVSSTAPTIFERKDGSFLLALGGSGGSRIFGAITQVILGMDWHWDVGHSVEAPRVHDQLFPMEVSIEDRFDPALVAALRAKGHNITLFDINEGRAEIQAVQSGDDGFLYAASDSRKHGVAAGY